MEPYWTWHNIQTGQKWPLLVFMEVTDGESSGALTGVTRLHSMHPDPYKVPTPAHLAPALLPSRTKMPLLVGGESAHLEGTEPLWTQPSGILVQQLGTCP